MNFVASDRWVKYTGHLHLLEGAQYMFVMLVQGVNRAGFDWVYFAIVQIFYFTLTGDAVNRFQVVLVMHLEISAFVDSSDVERKTHIVIFQ